MSSSRVLVVAALLSLCACKGADSGKAKAEAGAKSAEPAPPAADGSADAAAEADAEASAGDTAAEDTGATETDTGEPLAALPESFEKVGVDVCDQYVADYVACIDTHVAEADRDAQRRLVFENLTAWKQMTEAGPSAAKGLQTACRIAREQAKRATEGAGCEW